MAGNNMYLGNSFNAIMGLSSPVIENINANYVGINQKNGLVTLNLKDCDALLSPTTHDMQVFLDTIAKQRYNFDLETTTRMRKKIERKMFGAPVGITVANISEPANAILQAEADAIVFDVLDSSQNLKTVNAVIDKLSHATIRLNDVNGIAVSTSPDTPSMIRGTICDLPARHNSEAVIKTYMDQQIAITTYLPAEKLMENRYMGIEIPEIHIQKKFQGLAMGADTRTAKDFDPDELYDRIREATLIASRGQGLS